jgi:hypothetical protein
MSKTISSSNRLSHQLDEYPNLTSHTPHPDQQLMDQVKSNIKLQVIHAIAGRIRISTTDNSWDSQIENLSQELKQQSWVLEIVEKKDRGSVTFTFDEKQLPLPQVLQVLTEFDVKYTPLSAKPDFSELKSPGFWQKQSNSLIPFIMGLIVTRGLRIRGWPSILVYMLIADGTRWLMTSLEPGLVTAVMSKTVQKLATQATPIPGFNKVSKKSITEVPTPGKIDYKIVHQIPGRVRFHLNQIHQDPAYCQRLEKLLKTDGEVSNFRLNIQAGSVMINYHHSETSISHWVQLMELALSTEVPTSKPLVSTPQPPVEENLTTEIEIDHIDDKIDIDLSTLWRDLKPGIMSYSLSVMANFPL